MTARLPAGIEAKGWIRAAQAAGGFAMVLHKGDPDAGTIALVTLENHPEHGLLAQLWERMPRADGSRPWTATKAQDPESKQDFNDYMARRTAADPDLWLLELTIADAQQFIGNFAGEG
ncbi:DUF1491 family protein [Novosphingobium sp. B-7]|uniref:DUF1491 family protein n=1 Tax=Novosphingobium sp. B-7 TaxID=1298855 RepID=UPI0003B2FBCF|nr:DUF1491 family protein [Novosphingobium sp. B-7]